MVRKMNRPWSRVTGALSLLALSACAAGLAVQQALNDEQLLKIADFIDHILIRDEEEGAEEA